MSEDRDFRVLCDLHAQGMHVTVGYEATADGARNVHFFPITRQGPGVKSQIVGFIKQYLKEQELPRERVHLVMAVAGPVIDDAVHVPALNVDLTDGRLKAELKVASVEMVNDMFACALALPAILAEGNYLRLGGRRPLHGYPILIICLRPELGSVAMVPFTWKPPVNAPDASPIFFPVFSEVGHILLAPGADEQEIAFVDARARAMGKRIEAGDVFQTDGVRAAYNFVQQREANEDSVGDQWKEDSLTARLGRQVWTPCFRDVPTIPRLVVWVSRPGST